MRLPHKDCYYTAPNAACETREQSYLRAGAPHSSGNTLDNRDARSLQAGPAWLSADSISHRLW